jgi:hypothetical protein
VSLRELVDESELAVVGYATSAESAFVERRGTRRIVTTTRFSVDTVLGGSGSTELAVHTLGGRVDKIGQVVHGEAFLLLGERALLFLTRDPSAGLFVTHFAQGHFPILRASDGRERLVPSPRLSELRSSGESAVARLVGLSPVEGTRVVREAFRDAHR